MKAIVVIKSYKKKKNFNRGAQHLQMSDQGLFGLYEDLLEFTNSIRPAFAKIMTEEGHRDLYQNIRTL